MTVKQPNLSTQYNPKSTEAKWQEFWESQEIFKADPNHDGEPYCIVIPPPNVTGSLHMGHAFEASLIDTLMGNLWKIRSLTSALNLRDSKLYLYTSAPKRQGR